MKEQVTNCGSGPCLRVYPHLPPDTPDEQTFLAGHVEARRHWGPSGGEEARWGVNVNINYASPMTRRQSDELTAAIARCWQWVDAQPPGRQ